LVEEKTFAELDELVTKLLFACPAIGVDDVERERAERRVTAMIAELEVSLLPPDLLRLQCLCALRLGFVDKFLDD
jgi:hypothetical protein